MDICKEQMPSYINVDTNHKVACWLIEENVDGKAS
jgi:hypothetical protein